MQALPHRPDSEGSSVDREPQCRVLGHHELVMGIRGRVLLLFQLGQFQRLAQQHPDLGGFACGYDLRGTINADRSRCPECGAPIERIRDSSEESEEGMNNPVVKPTR